MLVQTMTPEEVRAEIYRDWQKVQGTIERLGAEYDRERRKKKIGKEEGYSKAYPIKTASKNTWIFFYSKAPAETTYKGLESINICSVVYYYATEGLRVFKMIPGPDGVGINGISAYNAHVFSRWNERMGKSISKPLDKVIEFFISNGYTSIKVLPKDGREYTLGVCRDGLLLGELQNGRRLLVQKTFITRDLARPDQDAIEADLIEGLQKDIEELINSEDFDRDGYNYRADIIKGLSG